MPTRFLTMLSVGVCALALLFAGIAVAQEDTTEETTVLAADAADMKVEAETDNTSVEVDNGEVSVSTDNDSSSDDGTSQQSSMTVQQNQATDGTGSRASTGDVSSNQQITTQATNLNGKTARIEGPNSVDVDRVVISGLRNCEESGGTVRVSVRQSDNDGSTTANFTDGNNTFIEVDSGQVVITPNNGNLLNVPSDFNPGNGTVTNSSGIRCGNNNNNNNNNRNRHHNRHRDHDRNRHRHHDRDRHNNRFFGRGAANQQYERNVEERVIRETVPNKGRLAATGGTPLLPLAGIALLGTGLFVGRSVLRERR
jgi:hypothetical protein